MQRQHLTSLTGYELQTWCIKLRRASAHSRYMCTAQGLSQEIAQGDTESLPEVLSALPWLLARFKAALGRHARAAAAEAAEAAAAESHGSKQRGALPGGPSADFCFFAQLAAACPGWH